MPPIESGSINEWLANPIPEDKIGQEYTIDLVGGQDIHWTMLLILLISRLLFVVAKESCQIKMTGNASFLTNNGFKLKFADIDYKNLE